jgi:hypothetical protein
MARTEAAKKGRDMAGSIAVEFPDPGSLFGVKGIEVLVDGTAVGSLAFGGQQTFSCPPGSHTVQAVLRAVMTRHSNTLTVEVAEGASVHVAGIYDRIFGSIALKEA